MHIVVPPGDSIGSEFAAATLNAVRAFFGRRCGVAG
jgi:hypothetical protein